MRSIGRLLGRDLLRLEQSNLDFQGRGVRTLEHFMMLRASDTKPSKASDFLIDYTWRAADTAVWVFGGAGFDLKVPSEQTCIR